METKLALRWEQWWIRDRNHKMEVNDADYRALDVVSFWKKTVKQPIEIITAGMPALHGPHQDRAWVSLLRDVSRG